jgi:hypothetical protein
VKINFLEPSGVNVSNFIRLSFFIRYN